MKRFSIAAMLLGLCLGMILDTAQAWVSVYLNNYGFFVRSE